MDTFHAAAAVVTDWLLETTVHVAVLFALVLGVCATLGRRIPARWRHALWALVLVRLLLPALPASPASVHNVARVVTQPALVAGPTETPRAPTDAPRAGAVAQLVPAAAAQPRASLAATGAAPWPWRSTAALVWLAGALLALGRLVLIETRFAAAVRRETPCDDPRVAAALRAVLEQAGVRRRVQVVVTDLGDGPALTGLLRPRVLLPGRVLSRLSDEDLRHVLSHEVAHLAAGDVLQNWLLAALEALHWFDPLVRVAGARVRAERESLRDLAATRGAPQEGRTAYGRTLLRLLESGPRRVSPPMAVGLFERRGDLGRRIEMIANGSGGRRAWVLGAGLTAAVAAVALTGASGGAARAQDEGRGTVVDENGERVARAEVKVARPAGPAAMAAEDGPHIEVVRRSEKPEWEGRVKEALAKRTSVNLVQSTAADLVRYIGGVTGLNFVIHPDAEEAAAEPEISLKLDGVSAEQALRLALDQVGMTYGVVDGVVQVGGYGQVRATLDQRFYKIAPILDSLIAHGEETGALDEYEQMDADERASYRGSLAENVIALCQNYVADQDSWCREGVSIATWGEVLVVEQDAATQDRLEAFLNLLLVRGARAPEPSPWRVALSKKLEKRLSLDFRESPLTTVVGFLADSTDVSIVVAPEAADDVTLTLKLADVTALEAVNWVARQSRLHVAFQDGAVVFTNRPPTTVRIYDVSRTFPKGVDPMYDSLIDLILTSVAPASWEEYGSVEYFEGMLFVRNTEDVQAQIVDFLEVARKAQAR